jgi:hypothetical protein
MRKRRHNKARPHRRRRNPFKLFGRTRRRHNPRRYLARHYRHRRRNPVLAAPLTQVLPLAGWAIVGGVATRTIPQMLLKEKNTGISGYGANALTALGVSMALGKFLGSQAGLGSLLGGITMLAGRIIADYFGKTVVEFSSLLGGDVAFDLGLYTPSYFAVPTVSSGRLQTTRGPIAALPPAKVSISGLGANPRFRSRFAA